MRQDWPHILIVLESRGEGGAESWVLRLMEWFGDGIDAERLGSLIGRDLSGWIAERVA